jgi:hypothetical protein
LLAGRKTLHGHWLCWVRLLQKLRDMLFHANNTLKEEARGEFVRYADKIMSSSFGDFDLELTHSCGVKEGQMKSDVSSPTLMGDEVQSQSAQLNPIVGFADELFYDNAAASPSHWIR